MATVEADLTDHATATDQVTSIEPIRLFVFRDGHRDGEILKELNNQSNDRAVGIVGGAYIQDVVLWLIKRKLRSDEKQFDELFEPGKAVGDFAAQARLAYMLGIITEEQRADLKWIAKIRNLFAHRWDITTFEHAEVAPLTAKLKRLESQHSFQGQIESARGRFSHCLATMGTELLLATQAEPPA